MKTILFDNGGELVIFDSKSCAARNVPLKGGMTASSMDISTDNLVIDITKIKEVIHEDQPDNSNPSR